MDLVVVFESLPNACRETFSHKNFPVEAFVHDPETLNYFMGEDDVKSGFPIMISMVLDGVEIPAKSAFSQRLKRLADFYCKQRPRALGREETERRRYAITNLVDDLRAPRDRAETTASGANLYEVLADFYFRSNGFRSAKSKSIPRLLRKTNVGLASRFDAAFDELFVSQGGEKVIAPFGGFLPEIKKLDAPASSRKTFDFNGLP